MDIGVTAQVEEQDLPELDVLGEDFQADAVAALAAARTRGGLARSRRGVEVLGYDQVAALVNDTRLDSQNASVYARMGGPPSLVDFAEDGLLVAMSGDKHRRIRRVFSAGFRVRYVQSQRSVMHATALDLVGSWGEDDCEFVREFSSPFPMHVLCRLLGVPVDDIPIFTAAATELHLLAAVPLAPGFPRIDAALRKLADYIADLVDRRRRRPEEDIVSSLIAVQETEGRLSDTELAWNLVNLIFAGQDTTRYQLASTVRAIVETPGTWERLAEQPELIPAAVEEALRLYPVTRFLVRIPSADLTIGNLRVRAGRRVILNLLAASRDPDRFQRPDELVVPRKEPLFDIPFGWGMHHCLGATVARVEMEAAIAALVTACTDVRIAQPPEFTPPAGMLYGPERMRLTFSRRG
ncbi:MAG TPA: cytochrome P450 [Pseudonocardiaceae bacterium]|nr:cytochrome P450 [Pseudonocardiaceae bacterium]